MTPDRPVICVKAKRSSLGTLVPGWFHTWQKSVPDMRQEPPITAMNMVDNMTHGLEFMTMPHVT